MTASLRVIDLGLLAYAPALQLQREVAHARIEGRLTDDVLLLVQHPPVVTLGRGSKDRHLLASPDFLASRGVELFEVERGGDITYHGPGQLVGYPILDLKEHRRDLHWYLRQLEAALIQGLAASGLPCTRNPGFTGVWTAGLASIPSQGEIRPTEATEAPGDQPWGGSPLRKVASIGVHAKDWVTWHGFALNITTDLANFDLIVPCGIQGVTMTTVRRELGQAVNFEGVSAVVVEALGEVFNRLVVRETPEWLESGVAAI
jgi:lipoyl(octanoyl) transferase